VDVCKVRGPQDAFSSDEVVSCRYRTTPRTHFCSRTQQPAARSLNMVYESDFYTTRRPYSRPTVTSYSVTVRTTYSDRNILSIIGHLELTASLVLTQLLFVSTL